MFSILAPHYRIDHVLDLSVERMRSLGRVGLLLDVDSTLKDHGSPVIPPDVKNWIGEFRSEGFKLCLLSNGKPHRIGALADGLKIPFVAKAFKPLPYGCRKAMNHLQLQPSETVIIGDQLFADILAGHLAKIMTILVRPTSLSEPWWTRLKRPFERFALRHMSLPVISRGVVRSTAQTHVSEFDRAIL
jgi:uncharacterized protein